MYVLFKFEFAVAELDLQEDPTSGGKNSVWVCVWGGVAVKNMALSTKILMTFPLYLEHVKIKGLFLAISEAGVIPEEG